VRFQRLSPNTVEIIANVDDYRKKCKSRLPRFLYDYISGGSYQENTLRANIADLQATLLRQRVMVDESHLSFSVNLWDQELSLPVVLGPAGMAGMYSSRGEVKAANAARAVGGPFTLSTMGVCDVHEVAKETGIPPTGIIQQLDTEDQNAGVGVPGLLGVYGSMCGQRLGMKPQG
jgi:L-lactate dehydrogenase (cytochrome)